MRLKQPRPAGDSRRYGPALGLAMIAAALATGCGDRPVSGDAAKSNPPSGASPPMHRDDPLVDRILRPPLRNLPRIDRAWDGVLTRVGARNETTTTTDGVQIAYTVLEPRVFKLRPRLAYDRTLHDFAVEFRAPEVANAKVMGTVVLTHGWGLDSRSVLPWALEFGERGYRTVLVDLRGHGRSDAVPIGFGTREGADLAAVVHALRASHRMQEPLALFGVSYGAVAAIHAAADPELGVDVLVAFEPFANAGDAIRRMGGFAEKGGSGSWRKRLAAWWARTRISGKDFEEALDRASERLDTNLRTLDTGPILQRVSGCTLLLQGGSDSLIDVAAVRAMAAAASSRVIYVEAPKEGHLTLPARFDWLGRPVAEWVDKALGAARNARCPSLHAPRDGLRRQNLQHPG